MWGTGWEWHALGYAEIYLMFKFKLMGLEIGGSLAGTFFQDFSWTYILGRTSNLVTLFLIRVLWILLVPCESELASATAERFLVCAQTILQTRAPSGLYDAGVVRVHSLISCESQTTRHRGETSDVSSSCCEATS